MSHHTGRRLTTFRSVRTAALAVGTAVSVAVALVAVAAPAGAATPVPTDMPATGVTADALPTAQIDGVAWNQTVAGNTVYVGGSFKTARPAGAASGTRTVAHANFLAYTLSTGVMTSFAPQFDNQVYAVAVSPDGKTLYVGGQFTKVTIGSTSYNRYRLAAFDIATGTLLASFAPSINYIVKSVVATDTTVYIGGSFSTVQKTTRNRLAALQASNGALLPWNPNADNTVNAMVLTPNGSRVVVGGNFQNVGGAAAYGVTAVSAAGAGARVTWTTDSLVRDAGSAAAITALSTDGTYIYGGGYVFGSGGNLEGAFQANASNGAVKWIEDCHGDTYGVWASTAAVYTVGHTHTCETVGGWPQTSPATYQHATAFTRTVEGTVAHNTEGGYQDWYGNPAPALISWFPDLTTGTYTGKTQAAWNVTGNDRYVVLGGEFPTVNGVAQQGLVRFAVPSVAPDKMGPVLSGGQVKPTATSRTAGKVDLSIPTNWDRDNHTLTYTVYRDNTLVKTLTSGSTFWDRPTLSYTDTVAAGTHSYRVYGTDSAGNQVRSDGVNITVS